MTAAQLFKSPYTGLAFHAVYAVGNSAIGLLTHSWWFTTVGAYYAVLAITRFSVLLIERKSDDDTGLFVRRLTGVLLVVLSLCIVGMNILSAVKDRGTAFHEIAMITIATYTFFKITVAIIGMVKARRAASPTLKTLRNLSLADASVSVYAMQRSMLVSFPGMAASAVWIVVLLLGINLIGGKYTTMAKSKIVKANEKIAEAVTDGYKKIEKGDVDGYKKIEKGVVDGYTKIEDKFVDAYLTRDGETVEEAKARLKSKK